MVYHAIKICSNHHLLHEEFECIKVVAVQNGYSLNFVESQIRKTLERTYENMNKKRIKLSENFLKKDEKIGNCYQIFSLLH